MRWCILFIVFAVLVLSACEQSRLDSRYLDLSPQDQDSLDNYLDHQLQIEKLCKKDITKYKETSKLYLIGSFDKNGKVDENHFYINTEPQGGAISNTPFECHNGETVGENVNYLYCENIIPVDRKVSATGEIEEVAYSYKLKFVVIIVGNMENPSLPPPLENFARVAEKISVSCEHPFKEFMS